jgi:arylformamidase
MPKQMYDVTVPISELMAMWPGDPRVKIERVSSITKGDGFNTSRLNLSSHTGTHVDAPYHFVQQGLTVDKLPLDVLVGPAFIAEMDGLEGNTIEVFDLARLHFPRDTTRLLLKTSNSYFWEDRLSEFEYQFVHLGPQTAEWLVKRGIQMIGVDYLSVEAFGAYEHQVHQTLLQAGVVIVEGLNLSRVPAGRCHVICLPLKIEGGDGAPARVLVIRE